MTESAGDFSVIESVRDCENRAEGISPSNRTNATQDTMELVLRSVQNNDEFSFERAFEKLVT